MTNEERIQKAIEFAKLNKEKIAKQLTDTSNFIPDEDPISVFMAGSPGAGKTEYSKNLIEILEKNKKHKVIRIDGDDLRKYIPGYTGSNSAIFQGAVFLVKKNFETHEVEDIIEIEPNESAIDDHLKRRYTKGELESIL